MIITHKITCPKCGETVKVEGNWYLAKAEPSVGYGGECSLEECDPCPKCGADVTDEVEGREDDVFEEIEDRKAEAAIARYEDRD